jgi:hypothetical protein
LGIAAQGVNGAAIQAQSHYAQTTTTDVPLSVALPVKADILLFPRIYWII